MSEIVQTVLSNFIDWLFKPLDNAASSMITGAFTGTAGTVSNSQWNIAITAANRIGWIMGFVNMAICIIGSLHAAVKGSVAESVKSFAMCVLAWPLTAVSVSTHIAKILNVQLSGDTASGEFSDSVVSNLVGTATKYGAQADMLIRLVVYVLVWFASLALSGMLAARLLSLVLLAAVAPLPIMMSGWRITRPAALKWVEAVAGVMLVKPLSALILMVGSALLNVANNDTNVSSSFFPTLIGLATLFMCCFSPRLVMPAVSFIGANVTGEMQERGGKVGPGAVKTAAQVTAGGHGRRHAQGRRVRCGRSHRRHAGWQGRQIRRQGQAFGFRLLTHRGRSRPEPVGLVRHVRADRYGGRSAGNHAFPSAVTG